jgi:prolipoprotein diacylglyceryl transferase
MLPVVQFGPLAVQVPGLVLLAGLWLGLSLSERHAPRSGISPNHIYNLVFIGFLTGILAARLLYVIRYPSAFASSPASVFSLNPGLLDYWGGAALGLIAALIYGQRKALSFWAVADTLTPALAVLAVAAGLAHLASGSAFGAPTGLPWGIELWGARRHPTQIYEILGAVLILVILWPRRGLVRHSAPGSAFLTFVAFSAGLRLILEGFRGDSILLPGSLRSAQVAAWVVLAVSLWGLRRLERGSKGAAGPGSSGTEQSIE